MITARRFTAFHKPLAHRIHCWSFPRLQRQWQVFLLPLIHCKEYQTIVLFFRSDHFIDSTTPPPYFLFVVGCDSWEHVTWYPFEPIRESMKFPLHFKYSGAQSTWELEDLTGVISNGKKKNLLALVHVKSSLHSCGLYFFQETDWRTIINWNHICEKKVRLRKA